MCPHGRAERLAEHFACRGVAQRRRAQKGGLLAGRAHCAMPILGAREYGLVRTCTDLYGPSFAGGFGGQAAQGYVGAMRSGNSKAQGTLAPCAMSLSSLSSFFVLFFAHSTGSAPASAALRRGKLCTFYHSTWRTITFLPVWAASRAARQVKTLRNPS